MKRHLSMLSVLAVGLLSINTASANALIGPQLSEQLKTQFGPYNVIVTFNEQARVETVLQGLSVPYRALQTMPMAGATLSKLQLEMLQANPFVTSVYANTALEYKYGYQG